MKMKGVENKVRAQCEMHGIKDEIMKNKSKLRTKKIFIDNDTIFK